MLPLRTMLFAGLTALAFAVPVPANFEADPILAITNDAAASSYASKRANFEADPMLSVNNAENESSYAKKQPGQYSYISLLRHL
ncbi:hypothetical protein DSL72_002493 [Monilinia vaccinii-corymbosi]|uniref:Uncharacterized protein n=1 Tax=Monilinia vaccinii-corymbosi TaxID=61207 RepID=A0A8A3PCN5_9HELO|nr:hypothetical protein DSL72_002493 [Monilinia vaccinii-corymbosi]